MIVAKTTGFEAALKSINAVGEAYDTKSLQENALSAAEFARTVTVVEMEQSGGGVFWPGNVRPSSRPGNYPAVQTSALVGTLNAHELPASKDIGRAALDAGGNGVDYARALEFGTSHAAPRPYMRTTVRKYRKEILARLGARKGRIGIDAPGVKYY
jgi:HK97 gp10 family phage protein